MISGYISIKKGEKSLELEKNTPAPGTEKPSQTLCMRGFVILFASLLQHFIEKAINLLP